MKLDSCTLMLHTIGNHHHFPSIKLLQFKRYLTKHNKWDEPWHLVLTSTVFNLVKCEFNQQQPTTWCIIAFRLESSDSGKSLKVTGKLELLSTEMMGSFEHRIQSIFMVVKNKNPSSTVAFTSWLDQMVINLRTTTRKF